MLTYLLKNVNTIKAISGFLLAFLVIVLSNLGFFPLNQAIFIIATIVLFMFSTYNPYWIFGLFLVSLPLEVVNLAPQSLGITVRPYQFIGSILVFAVVFRAIQGKFHIFKFKIMDWLILAFAISAFLGYFGSSNSIEVFKQAIILASFAILYFLGRIFFQKMEDLRRFIPWFLGSSFFVAIYSVWQNWRFLYGGNHFEVMPGRANGTFTEADWLGMFLVLILSIIFVWIYNESFKIKSTKRSLFLYFYLLLIFIAIIVTVSRSAWLGAGIVLVTFFVFLVWKFWKNKSYDNLRIISSVVLTGVISLFLVKTIPLTNFELGNRIQSTGSGLQEITISCKNKQTTKQLQQQLQQLEQLEQLEHLKCRHINLEEIETEKEKGNFVTRVKREDPNVSIRKEIYQTSMFEAITGTF